MTMPSTTATFDAVRGVLNSHFEVSSEALEPATPLASLGLDSLALMEFVFAVEDRFSLRIPEERLDPRQAHLTLADLCRAIDDAQAGPQPVAA